MFDVGFSELLLCFLVALVVLGPQKLPAVARAVGRWTGRARSYVRNLTTELEREAGSADLRRELADAARVVREGAAGVKDDLRKLTDVAGGQTQSGEAAGPSGPSRKSGDSQT
jgi:sec-independent protein translocase protein TatB